jgi:hypothetical protein
VSVAFTRTREDVAVVVREMERDGPRWISLGELNPHVRKDGWFHRV